MRIVFSALIQGMVEFVAAISHSHTLLKRGITQHLPESLPPASPNTCLSLSHLHHPTPA
ncbi:UNVERIFIED_CONTAM: hypothetical protein FKN15_019080 [Acipenser sinensis]